VRARLARATVKLTAKGGQGILVPGGYIITAAHCVEYYGSGGMTLGEHILESVKTADGVEFRVSPVAVHP
jgi:hypothetical protein